MKKLLIILGTVFLAVILLVAVVIGMIAVRGSALDKESKAYVDRNLPLIFSTWDEQELLSRASPEFTQNTRKEDLDKDFAGLSRKFGKMQSYEGSEGQCYVNYRVLSSHNGKVITAVYSAKVTFAGGPAAIRVTLIKHDDAWQIEGFNINSNVLLQR
jgi:hypothetical protein